MGAGLLGMCVSLGMGRLVDILPDRIGFPLVFGLGALFALLQIIILSFQPEIPKEPKRELKLLEGLINPFRDRDFKLYTFFIALWNFSVIMPGQFFSVFMLKYLNLSYTTIVLVGASSGIAGLLAQPLFGYLADRYANKSILILTSLIASFVPFVYIFMDPRFPLLSLFLLYAINIISGAAWAGIGLTQFNLLLLLSPPEQRMSYVGTYSAFISLTGAGSPLIGGVVVNALRDFRFSLLGLELTDMKVLFLISTALRLLSLPLLSLVKEGREEESPLELVREIVPKKPLETVRALRGLGSSNEETRIRAIRMLGTVHSPLAVDNLLKLLADPSPEVRREAIIALGEIGDKNAIEPLLNHLAVEKGQVEVIGEAMRKLGAGGEMAGREERFPASFFSDLERKEEGELIQLLQEIEDEEISSYIVFILAKRGCKAALPQILNLRERISSPLYRRQWVYSIGKLLGVDVYPLLSLDHLELYQKIEALLRGIGEQDERARIGIRLALRYFDEGDYDKFIQRLARSLPYENLPEEIKEVISHFIRGKRLSLEEAILLVLCLLKGAKG